MRRTGLVLLWLFVTGAMAMLAAAGTEAVSTAGLSAPWLTVIEAGAALCFATGLVLGLWSTWRSIRPTEPPQPRKEPSLAWWVLGSRFVVLVTLPLSGPLLFGFAVGWLPGIAFARELPEERRARFDLERKRREIAEREARYAAELKRLLDS